MNSSGQRGSVKQATNGTWTWVVDIGIGPDGKRHQARGRGCPTKREAQRRLTEKLGELSRGEYVAPRRQTLGAFLTDTWLPAVEYTIKPGTFESYRRNVRLHIAGRAIGRRQLQDLDGAALNALYALLLAGDAEHRPLSARSVRYIATILHRAMRDAVRWQAIVRNPVDQSDPPRQGSRTEHAVWTAQQLGVFLGHVSDDRLAGAWWLLATTGMRRGEVLGLRWADIDLDAGVLVVRRTLITTDVQRKDSPGFAWGTPKTAKGRRSVALDPATVTALRSHRARQLEERMALGSGYADGDLVVADLDGGPLHPKRLSYWFGKTARAAGLPTIRLHDLRHTHATLALRAGVHPRVVQERLGHANVSITLDTYSHVDMTLQTAAAAQVAALVTGASS